MLCPSEAEAMRRAAQVQRQHFAQLMAHPDCRDPYHPGCERCEAEEDDYEEEGEEE